MNQQIRSCSKPSAAVESSLQSTMEKLYNTRNTTGDIKFIIDGEEIHAHGCVLAAHSQRYRTQFYGGMAEKEMVIENVARAEFEEFLQFFYLNRVTLTLDNIENVLTLAKLSLVDELVDKCTNFIKDAVGVDNLLWVHQLDVFLDMQSMQEFWAHHIGINIKSVFQTDGFLDCQEDVLCDISDFDSLNCKEIDILHGLGQSVNKGTLMRLLQQIYEWFWVKHYSKFVFLR